MKKVRGKALALVLSLALVVSSFSTAFTSAASRTLKGDLSFDGGDEDFYFVNGDANAEKVYDDFGDALGDPTLKAPNHEEASDVYISDISHKSGDHLVKWYDGSDGEDSISDETDINDIDLKLRNASASGEEKLSVLYSGTYTDDDDKEYTVKASKDITIRVYDKGQVVIGEGGANTPADGKKGELDDNFAQKTVKHEANSANPTDSKELVALRADEGTGLAVHWDELKTYAKDDDEDRADDLIDGDDTNSDGYMYVLDSSSDNLKVSGGITGTYGDATTKQNSHAAGEPSVGFGTVPATGTDVGAAAAKVTKEADGTLTVERNANDTTVGSYKSYYAAIGTEALTAPADGTKVIDTTDAADVAKTLKASDFAGLEATDKIVITAFDSEGTAVTDGTIIIPAADTTIQAVDAKDCPKLTQDNDDPAKFTIAKAENDTTSNWTYAATYQAGSDDTPHDLTITDDAVTLPEPTAADTVTLTVTATSGSDVKGSATATVPVEDLRQTVGDSNAVLATVKPKAGATNLTLTAEPTKLAKDKKVTHSDGSVEDYLASDSEVKQKIKIEKTIKVNDPQYTKLGKDGTNTYIYTGTLDDDAEDNGQAIKVNGFEVKFDEGAFPAGASVVVDDKANVEKISGAVNKVTLDGDSSVDEIATDISDDDITAVIEVSEATVGSIDFDDDAKGTVSTDSHESEVGDITDATTVTVNNGKVGNIDADGKVTIKADDEDYDATVGDVSAQEIEIDSEDSKGIKTGTLTATDDDSEFDISGDAVTVGGIDFDNYGVELKLEDFQGEIPAPQNATNDNAVLSTEDADDKVTIKGDADINSISIADESQITSDDALNVGDLEGAGRLKVAPGKLYVSDDASDIQLELSGSFKAGDVAYTSAHDTIDEDSFDNYGFTVTKTEGSSTDTFKVASLEFTGLTIAPATAEIAKGQSKTFTASAYAPGSAIPEGYSIKFDIEGNDQYFTAVDNGDGTATVTVTGVDDTFPSENKATLTAYLVDADGATNDDYDEGEADIKAVAVPATNFKSDTTGNVPLKVGQTYQFKITSLDGTAPTFGVAGNGATVQYAGATGSDYFYKVTGAKEGSYGVYVNGGGVEHRAAILVIKGVNVTTDTTAVTKAPGQTYQFKITAPSQPSFGAVGLKSVLASKSGNNYFYKVTASNVKGGHGIYVNGVRVAIFTVA